MTCPNCQVLIAAIDKALNGFWMRKTEHPGHSETYFADKSADLPYNVLTNAINSLRAKDSRFNIYASEYTKRISRGIEEGNA